MGRKEVRNLLASVSAEIHTTSTVETNESDEAVVALLKAQLREFMGKYEITVKNIKITLASS